LAGLARAHLSSIGEVVAAHSRDRDPARRAERIRDAARAWLLFWRGRLDLDSLAWEVAELLSDIEIADAAHRAATQRAVTLWRANWPDDRLTSVPGVGEICASSTRAWWDHGHQLLDAKAAAVFIGLNPSNWESGLSASPSRPITKEGPPALRLAYYQAANVARRHDPGLAFHYRKLVIDRRHKHTHLGQLRGGPQTGRPHLGGAAHQPALPAPRSRRRTDRLGHRHRPRRLHGRARRGTTPSPTPARRASTTLRLTALPGRAIQATNPLRPSNHNERSNRPHLHSTRSHAL
jgi:hypothetical protein